MASATFDQLKTEVAMKAEESGTLPTTVTVGGTQYTLADAGRNEDERDAGDPQSRASGRRARSV